MKAIAEYFRDLAAGDRYFGAEPPTPDAEMLTRIAEREISRRVDVRSSETGIVLRASEPAAVPMQVAAPMAAAAPAPAPTPAAPTPAPAPAPVQAEVAAPSVADAPAAVDAPTADATAADSDESPVMPPAPRRPVETDTMREKAIAAARDAAPVEAVAQPAAPRTEPPAHPDSESVAAKLQRIRAVVGGVNPASAPSAFVEDLEETAPVAGAPDQLETPVETAEPAPKAETAAVEAVAEAEPETDDIVADDTSDADVSGDEATSLDQDDAETDTAEVEASAPVAEAKPDEAEPDAAPTAEADETDDQISAVLRNLQRAGLRTTQADASPEEAEAATAPAAPRGRILRVTRRQRPVEATEAVATLTAADIAQLATEKSEAADQATPKEDDDASAASTSVAAMMAATQDAPQAQVDVADLDEAVDDTAELSDDRDDAASTMMLDDADDMSDFDTQAADSTLSDDDEADLQRTLAALRHEDDADTDTAPEVEPTSEVEAAPAAETTHKLRRDPLPDTSEAEMSRIMSQANEELADPEASRRRNAIAQLKAAVAATEAARQLGETGDKRAEAEDVFREDLDQVVRPRRAPRAEGTSDRGERARPAPLKLVPSQRVDLEKELAQDKADGPVQPRRVATAAPAPTQEAGNFAEFAENMGATSLQDLLEAAAAYTAFVEGSEDFSRPHIMQKVRQTVSEDFSREDGLRSFGTLLRQGRIERVRNGRFAVSERIRFKPEAMAVGS
ncbi:hypothetical protein KBW81_04410 [Loktanella salsilacus]|uniref:hypothetical protein n=1 Tax=Loktanella salsilacus TaxID=195913 RepID=UPI0020B73213|nr:hypothetical protein [Loktanella salsilacus]UTH49047.1 hypothetical protein KBW81_04410 [Loktanella salsilacus]